MHRFFLPPENFHASTITITEPETIHQLARVLRMQVGSECLFLDGSGREFLVTISAIEKSKVEASIKETRQNKAEPEISITLYQALPKNPARTEQIVQHGTEIGIVKFVPLLTERTEVESLRNPERFHRIIREAAEQSGRGILPELTKPVDFQALLKNPPTGKSLPCQQTGIIGDSFGSPPLLSTLLPELKQSKTLNLFIGPEGGFSEQEISLAIRNGIQAFSLGKRILRTETAGVAVASAILFS